MCCCDSIYSSKSVKPNECSSSHELSNNTSILNNYIFNYFDDLPLVEERIKQIAKVEKKDLIKCGKCLSLNTIYIQESGVNED